MRARKVWLTVKVDPVNGAGFVSGQNARALIIECGGRPVWSTGRKAWCTSAAVAADVLALADHKRCAIAYSTIGGDAA